MRRDRERKALRRMVVTVVMRHIVDHLGETMVRLALTYFRQALLDTVLRDTVLQDSCPRRWLLSLDRLVPAEPLHPSPTASVALTGAVLSDKRTGRHSHWYLANCNRPPPASSASPSRAAAACCCRRQRAARIAGPLHFTVIWRVVFIEVPVLKKASS